MAAELSTKKRRRVDDGDGKTKKKKVALEAPAATASVSSLVRPRFCPPVIASSPGIDMPPDLVFQSYVSKAKTRARVESSSAVDQALLLHSVSHRSLDYTAKEEEARAPSAPKPLLNHYLGVYDPATGKLQVVEAKKMVVRGAVRAKQVGNSLGEDKDTKLSMTMQRTELGQTFGTKKAKKVIQERYMNALTVNKQAGDGTPVVIDDASKAILESVGQFASSMATREELQAVVDDAKPVPRANLDATEIHDVYDPKVLIGADILKLVPILEWQEKTKHKENISVPSQFAAPRIHALASNDAATERLRVLRYYLFVLVFLLKSQPGRERGTRRVPPRDKLRELLAPAPDAVVENIRRKFSDGGVIRKFHADLLLAHCCVYALVVDNFEVDTEQLRLDLRLDQKTMNQYFYEIGAKVKPVKHVASGQMRYVAKLSLPLVFPKQRLMKARR